MLISQRKKKRTGTKVSLDMQTLLFNRESENEYVKSDDKTADQTFLV